MSIPAKKEQEIEETVDLEIEEQSFEVLLKRFGVSIFPAYENPNQFAGQFKKCGILSSDGYTYSSSNVAIKVRK